MTWDKVSNEYGNGSMWVLYDSNNWTRAIIYRETTGYISLGVLGTASNSVMATIPHRNLRELQRCVERRVREWMDAA
jgi:hypothetical protein